MKGLLLQMTPHNIRVTVAFPPDTDTPGLKSEMHGKVSVHNYICITEENRIEVNLTPYT